MSDNKITLGLIIDKRVNEMDARIKELECAVAGIKAAQKTWLPDDTNYTQVECDHIIEISVQPGHSDFKIKRESGDISRGLYKRFYYCPTCGAKVLHKG